MFGSRALPLASGIQWRRSGRSFASLWGSARLYGRCVSTKASGWCAGHHGTQRSVVPLQLLDQELDLGGIKWRLKVVLGGFPWCFNVLTLTCFNMFQHVSACFDVFPEILFCSCLHRCTFAEAAPSHIASPRRSFSADPHKWNAKYSWHPGECSSLSLLCSRLPLVYCHVCTGS